MRRIQYLGTTFRTRPDEVKMPFKSSQSRPWFALRLDTFGIPIDATVSVERAAEAFDLMRAIGHFGKIVITSRCPDPPTNTYDPSRRQIQNFAHNPSKTGDIT